MAGREQHFFACPAADSFSAGCQNLEGHSLLALYTAAPFVHVFVALVAGLALCYGESTNLTWPVPLPLWSRAHSSLELGLNPVHIETQLKPASSRPGSAPFLGNRTQTGFYNSVFKLEYRNSVYLKSWNWVLIRLILKVSSNPVQPDRVLCLCLGTGFKPGFKTGFSTGVI